MFDITFANITQIVLIVLVIILLVSSYITWADVRKINNSLEEFGQSQQQYNHSQIMYDPRTLPQQQLRTSQSQQPSSQSQQPSSQLRAQPGTQTAVRSDHHLGHPPTRMHSLKVDNDIGGMGIIPEETSEDLNAELEDELRDLEINDELTELDRDNVNNQRTSLYQEDGGSSCVSNATQNEDEEEDQSSDEEDTLPV
jgi:hypothetical protein